MQIVHTDRHRLRNSQTELSGGQLVRPYECPERVDYILAEAARRGRHPVTGPKAFGLDPVRRVHDAGYLDFLARCWGEWQALGYEGEAIPTVWPARGMRQVAPTSMEGLIGYYALAGETTISAGTWEAAQASCDVALTAHGLVAGGERAAFALCRPPGHHAAGDLFGGYCFINNVAVVAQKALDDGAARVAILDVDFHHGNGTQSIFYDRDDVLFVSLHGDPAEHFPHFLGYAEETGEGAGEGYNLNLPMPSGTDYATWSAALETGCRRIADYAPDLLIVSLGVDTYREDPISAFRLDSPDFAAYGARIERLGLPTLFVMEGGYAVEEIGINTVNVLDGFEGA